jgi:repressor LexA
MEAQRLHPLQEKLLILAKTRGISGLSLRELGRLVGDPSPQKIKHHLQQLEKRGLLKIDKVKGTIGPAKEGWVDGFLAGGKRLLEIPIVGVANCGPAEVFAEENRVGYLRVSNSLVHRQSNKGLFAVRADGFSMNQAKIHNETIDDGDYLVVDGEDREPRDGDVVLSVIDGAANVKRFHADAAHGQIVLTSDSTEDFAPIYVGADDDFFVNGKVIEVIKRPKIPANSL